jgi:hypothetical protein
MQTATGVLDNFLQNKALDVLIPALTTGSESMRLFVACKYDKQ